jgi:hypothetical protein
MAETETENGKDTERSRQQRNTGGELLSGILYRYRDRKNNTDCTISAGIHKIRYITFVGIKNERGQEKIHFINERGNVKCGFLSRPPYPSPTLSV